MDISFIYKSLKLTLLVSAVSAIAFLHYFSPRFSLGLISGSLWNVVNIFLFIRLSKALTREAPRKLNIFFVLASPKDMVGPHLKTLASISRLVKDKFTVELLRKAGAKKDILKIIADTEESL